MSTHIVTAEEIAAYDAETARINALFDAGTPPARPKARRKNHRPECTECGAHGPAGMACTECYEGHFA